MITGIVGTTVSWKAITDPRLAGVYPKEAGSGVVVATGGSLEDGIALLVETSDGELLEMPPDRCQTHRQ